jgi:TonB family protein
LKFKSTIIGLAASALLLAVLGFARIFVVSADVPDLSIRQVETVTFEPPPPPPPPEETPPDAPPPPPALTNLSELPDPTRVAMPTTDVPMDITLPVENFHADLEPAPLPVAAKPPKPARVDHKEQFFKKEQNYKPSPPPPVAKSHYSTNELDGTPRLLRHGSATFPSSLARQGVSKGTVVFEVELSTSGSVSVRRVVSSTHPDLVSPARRVASGARFTPPKRNGQAVKAIMRWPITIEK